MLSYLLVQSHIVGPKKKKLKKIFIHITICKKHWRGQIWALK